MIRAPSSAKYINQLTEKLLTPIKRGESAYVRWFPGHGKTAILHQIFSDNLLLKKNLGKYYQRFIFINIEGFLYSESDFGDFLDYIAHSVYDKLAKKIQNISQNQKNYGYKNTPILTIRKIISLCQKAVSNGMEIVLVVDAIDDFSESHLKQLFIALEYIIESNRERIHTHININKGDILEKFVTQSGLIQNIIPIPLPDRTELKFFITYYCEKWDLKIDNEINEEMYKYCGNDPVLIKETLRILVNCPDKKAIFNQPALFLKAKNNFKQYSILEQETINEITKTGHFSPQHSRIAKELSSGNFLNKSFGVPIIYEQTILENSEINELFIDKKTKSLFFGPIDLQKKLSGSEYKILIKLYKKFGKTVSRDEIAEILWGDKLLEQYSDWAIDKAVSRLREKLSRLSFHYQITTKKKSGFLLEI